MNVYIIGYRPPLLICLCRATHPTPFWLLWCDWDSAEGGQKWELLPDFTSGETEAFVFPTSFPTNLLLLLPPTYTHITYTYIHSRWQLGNFIVRKGLGTAIWLEVGCMRIYLYASFPSNLVIFPFSCRSQIAKFYQDTLFTFIIWFIIPIVCMKNYEGAEASPSYLFLELPLSHPTKKHLRPSAGHPKISCPLRPH